MEKYLKSKSDKKEEQFIKKIEEHLNSIEWKEAELITLLSKDKSKNIVDKIKDIFRVALNNKAMLDIVLKLPFRWWLKDIIKWNTQVFNEIISWLFKDYPKYPADPEYTEEEYIIYLFSAPRRRQEEDEEDMENDAIKLK